ncbi:uncharacterized protein PV07_08649 [Cladophialophora immunda]|uniref:Uncharacterized protein n=1 Tax=Cladophialophora immunda TaxID=569365 RepID=A0A0D2C2N0_9EURO|nr:uncharacterized protein PV07_08649 [Cladophialophora immunda]KIW25483.1 hypothetical protein PV07_08649 [Cladophialophora immunda]
MIQLVSPNIAQHPDCGYRRRYVSEEMAAFGYKHVERRNLTADGMKSLARDNANLRKGHMIQRHDRPIQNGKQLAWVPPFDRLDEMLRQRGELRTFKSIITNLAQDITYQPEKPVVVTEFPIICLCVKAVGFRESLDGINVNVIENTQPYVRSTPTSTLRTDWTSGDAHGVLQTLCIVANDHHRRDEEYATTQARDMRRLPSLIVCPPTLSGHWQQEIQQYAPFWNCVAYVGPAIGQNQPASLTRKSRCCHNFLRCVQKRCRRSHQAASKVFRLHVIPGEAGGMSVASITLIINDENLTFAATSAEFSHSIGHYW